jgi:hypothetical protein
MSVGQQTREEGTKSCKDLSLFQTNSNGPNLLERASYDEHTPVGFDSVITIVWVTEAQCMHGKAVKEQGKGVGNKEMTYRSRGSNPDPP